MSQLNKKYYRTSAGKEPAREFINSLDVTPRMRVFAQIDKLKRGNPGQGHGVGKVDELIIDDGPGYRVYYAMVDGLTLILLLNAGDKSSQQEDIKRANEYLADHLKRQKEAKKDEEGKAKDGGIKKVKGVKRGKK